MPKNVHTHLLFLKGQAEAALHAYAEIFDDFTLASIEHFDGSTDDANAKVQAAKFTLAGQTFTCQDSTPDQQHDFDMTPAVSLYVTCNDQAELERLFEALSDGGQVFMPLDDYGFSTRFGWLSDRYEVSWQLNLE